MVTPVCWVQGSGLRVQGAGVRVQSSGCRVQGSGCRVQGAGFRVGPAGPLQNARTGVLGTAKAGALSGRTPLHRGRRRRHSRPWSAGCGGWIDLRAIRRGQGAGCRVQGSGFRVQGSGFRVACDPEGAGRVRKGLPSETAQQGPFTPSRLRPGRAPLILPGSGRRISFRARYPCTNGRPNSDDERGLAHSLRVQWYLAPKKQPSPLRPA